MGHRSSKEQSGGHGMGGEQGNGELRGASEGDRSYMTLGAIMLTLAFILIVMGAEE